MKLILATLAALVFFACTIGPEKPEQISYKPQHDSVPSQNSPQYHPWQEPDTLVEAIDPDSVLIIGKFPFYSTKQQILKYLGKPDSIVSYAADCGGYFGDRQVKRYYYGQTFFEANKDTAVLIEMDFTSCTYIFRTPRITLSAKTTLSDLKRIYPEACRLSGEIIDEITKKPYINISLSVDSKIESDDRWFLRFENGKLARINYWVGC